MSAGRCRVFLEYVVSLPRWNECTSCLAPETLASRSSSRLSRRPRRRLAFNRAASSKVQHTPSLYPSRLSAQPLYSVCPKFATSSPHVTRCLACDKALRANAFFVLSCYTAFLSPPLSSIPSCPFNRAKPLQQPLSASELHPLLLLGTKLPQYNAARRLQSFRHDPGPPKATPHPRHIRQNGPFIRSRHR